MRPALVRHDLVYHLSAQVVGGQLQRLGRFRGVLAIFQKIAEQASGLITENRVLDQNAVGYPDAERAIGTASPIMVAMIGTRKVIISRRLIVIASRCGAPGPDSDRPRVSMSEITAD